MTIVGDVRNNENVSQYELEVDGMTAIAVYQRGAAAITFTHTEVPPALEGRGIASQLIKAALADARLRDLKVVPQCEFVASYIDQHPQEQDLLATGAPG